MRAFFRSVIYHSAQHWLESNFGYFYIKKNVQVLGDLEQSLKTKEYISKFNLKLEIELPIHKICVSFIKLY